MTEDLIPIRIKAREINEGDYLPLGNDELVKVHERTSYDGGVTTILSFEGHGKVAKIPGTALLTVLRPLVEDD